MDENGKYPGPLPPADGIWSVMLQPPTRLELGKTGDNRDVKRGKHISSGPTVRTIKNNFGCRGLLGDCHWKKQ
jgi:hypothetical protein